MIRLLIVDDNEMFRFGLGLLFRDEPGIEVVGFTADGLTAISLAETEQPDVILMDLSMPVLDGVSATLRILALVPSTRVLVLSSYVDELMIRQAFAAGALGYVTKGSTPAVVLAAIRAVHRGEPTFAPATPSQPDL